MQILAKGGRQKIFAENKKRRLQITQSAKGLWDKDMSRGFAFAKPIG